jgi:hypothetical protein
MSPTRTAAYLAAWGCLISILVLSSGCASEPSAYTLANPEPADLYDHILQFNRNGEAIDPSTQKKFASQTAANARFEAILDDMQAYFAKLKDNSHPKVILYVHGGLDSPKDSLAAASAHLMAMSNSHSDAYALFVIWDSGIWSTYDEHLFKVHQGVTDKQADRSDVLDFPLFILGDVLSAVARAPAVWLQERHTDDRAMWLASTKLESNKGNAVSAPAAVANLAAGLGATPLVVAGDIVDILANTSARMLGLPPNPSPTQSEAPATRQSTPTTAPVDLVRQIKKQKELTSNVVISVFYLELNQLYYYDTHRPAGSPAGPPKEIAISRGSEDVPRSDWIARGAGYTLMLPIKLVTSPIIDAFGTPGWHGMLRRAETVVEGPLTTASYSGKEQLSAMQLSRLSYDNEGGLDAFVQLLARRCDEIQAENKPQWEISLIAHSMGTMVINDLLRRQLQREIDPVTPEDGAKLPVKNIVYLAAACTIRNFLDAVVPFMQNDKHSDVKYYNLSLNPAAEVLEADYGDTLPRGSLLCWIDDFLATPDTMLDRTLGRWDNVLQVWPEIPPSLRGRVAIKAFSLKPLGYTPPHDTPNMDPQTHPQFSDSPFWDEQFWQPAPAFRPDDLLMNAVNGLKDNVPPQQRP